MLIPLVEYAKKHGKQPRVIRQKAASGRFGTAVKIGHFWLIDSEEPCLDLHKNADKKRFEELYGKRNSLDE